ncbi:MAG: hypothetical protein ACKOXB_03190 [Flavobacteriales bacterium]
MDNNPISFNDMFGDCPTCGHGEEVTVGKKNFKRTKVDAGSLSNEQKTMTNIDAWDDGIKREAHDNGNGTYYAKDGDGNYYLLTPADQAQAAKEIFIPTPEAILDDPNGLYKDYTLDQRRQFINSYYGVIDQNFGTKLSHPTISAAGSGSTSAQLAGQLAAENESKKFAHEYLMATNSMYRLEQMYKHLPPSPGIKSMDLDVALFFVAGPEEMVVEGVSSKLPYLGRKLDYVFGKATGNAHNIDRSTDMLRQLNRIGIFDNDAGCAYVRGHLGHTYNYAKGIAMNGRVLKESILTGPNGILKVQSIWQADQLITIKLIGKGL